MRRIITPAIAVLLAFCPCPAAAETDESLRIGRRTLARGDLPTGELTVGGVAFDLRRGDFVEVDCSGERAVALAQWPGGREAAGIVFLHTFQPGVGIEDWRAATGLAHRKVQLLPEWPEVFRYEIEYADGAKVTLPVRFGESIDQWYRVQTVGPMLWASDHWSRVLDAASGEKLVLYAMRIPNLRPGRTIKAVRALPPEQTYRQYGRALILGVATEAAPMSGKLYFVDRRPIGDDAQDGTLEQPFATLQHAVDVAGPGDTIFLRRGHYPLSAPVIKKFDGEEGKWWTLSSFPGETPTIDAFGVHYDYRVRPYAEDGARPEIGRMQHDSGVIHIWGDPDYTRIQGLRIVNSRRAAISVYGDRAGDEPRWRSWGGTDHVEIRFNTTFRSYSMGIISHQTNHISVIGNRVIRPHALEMACDPLTDEKIGQVALPQEGIDLSRNRNFEIAYNVVVGGGKEAIDCISVEDGLIHHNYVHSSLNGIYIDSWTVPIRRLEIYHNFIHNAYNGIPLSTEGGNDLMDFDIHHNIVLDSKGGGIGVSEATYKAKPAKVQRHVVRNNTVDGSGRHCIAIGWQAAGIGVGGFPRNENFREITVRDNIVTNTAGRPMTNRYSLQTEAHAIFFTHNLLWPTAEDTTPHWMRRPQKSWRRDDNFPGEKAIVADPRFVDAARGDFRLGAGSPAIGAATDGGDLGALPRGSAWIPGLDFAGHVTAYYQGDVIWEPVSIPRERYTMHRNHLQRPSWFQRGRYGPDFRDLPGGEQSLAGVTYWIAEDDQSSRPTVMALAGHSTESAAESISVPVGRSADRLAFLHTAHVPRGTELKDGDVLFHYRVAYVDGSSTDIPIRLGRQIAHWSQGRTHPIADGRIAWAQKVAHKSLGGRHSYLHLYGYQWDNPKPDTEVARIEILRDVDPLQATPAVFAISTGRADH